MNTTEELLEDIRAGRMVVVMDDEDRENEGDLIMAASLVRPEDINFMARHARGLICLALTRERCRQLSLPLMVNNNESRFTTNFTLSIEAAEGVTTGISAYDRAHTVRTAVRPNAQPEDLIQPGHVFPLMAQPGGVLMRAGHTEAAMDLAMLAGLEPAGVLVEILNEDGSMARKPELQEFAAEHQLKIGTIADLIRYRLANEKSIARLSQRQVHTEFGDFQLVTFRDLIRHQLHFALVRGEPRREAPTLVRVHVRNTLSDVLHIDEQSLGLPLRKALPMLARAECGVAVVLGEDQPETSLQQQAAGDSHVEPTASADELRNYGIGAQILADLGVGQMRVISAPKIFHGLSGFGLEVVEYTVE